MDDGGLICVASRKREEGGKIYWVSFARKCWSSYPNKVQEARNYTECSLAKHSMSDYFLRRFRFGNVTSRRGFLVGLAFIVIQILHLSYQAVRHRICFC